MNFTGQIIKFENGRTFGVHTKMTKNGLRHYYYSRGRFFPLSEMKLNKYIHIED